MAILAGTSALISEEQPGSVHPIVLARANSLVQSYAATAVARGAVETRISNSADKLNRAFRAVRVPLRVERFSSLYRIVTTQTEPVSSLYHAYLRERGVTSYADSLSMFTAAHSDAVAHELLALYRDAAVAMRRDGLIGRVDAPVQVGVDETSERSQWYLPPCEGAKLGYDTTGNPVWFAEKSGVAGDLVQVQE